MRSRPQRLPRAKQRDAPDDRQDAHIMIGIPYEGIREITYPIADNAESPI